MTKGRIFAYRRDRLGGRLRSMVNAMRLAEWANSELRVHWPVGRYAQELANPKEFFSDDFVDEFIEMESIRHQITRAPRPKPESSDEAGD